MLTSCTVYKLSSHTVTWVLTSCTVVQIVKSYCYLGVDFVYSGTNCQVILLLGCWLRVQWYKLSSHTVTWVLTSCTVAQIVKSYCYLGVDVVCSGTNKTAMFPFLSVITHSKISCDKSVNLFLSMMIRPIVLAHLIQHQIQAVTQNKTKLLTYMTSSYVDGIHQEVLKYILGVSAAIWQR